MKQEAKGQLADSLRPWVSLAITIHFFAIIVSLAANLSPSELERRVLNLLTPYTVGLDQDYQGVPLEMTRGSEIDYPCQFDIRRAGSNQWETIQPPAHLGAALDHRWRTFQRMAGIIALEQNEPIVHLLFEQCVRHEQPTDPDASIEAVRLVRRASLSYAADRAYVAGELPVAENEDRTLYECRVAKLDGDRIRLIPVLESMRTSKSLSKPSETKPGETKPTKSEPSEAEPGEIKPSEAEPSESERKGDESSLETQP